MAEFKIDGRMTVRTLKENFKKEFEGTLRVYDGREKAEDNATLASIRKNDDVKGGELVCRASRTVGKFEKEMLEVFGIKVQVASPDDWVLALDGITLANLKNIKKNATKADMEELVAYKRKSKTVSLEDDEELVCGQSDCRNIAITISSEGFKEISLLPILDEDCYNVIVKNDMDAESSYQDVNDILYECGHETLNFYFLPLGTEVSLSVVDEDSDEELYSDSCSIEAKYPVFSLESAEDNYGDDELEDFKARIVKTKLDEGNSGSIIANAIRKTWPRQIENKVDQDTFIPQLMSEALLLSESEYPNALIKGQEFDDEMNITFHIRLPKYQDFNPEKLDFISMDEAYDDKSNVIQELLATDVACINAIIYDGVMYFASYDNVLEYGGFAEEPLEQLYDYVNADIEKILE
jgi:hypothetical protein